MMEQRKASMDHETEKDWTALIAQEWADELADPLQDLYTIGDGEPPAQEKVSSA